MVCYRTQPEINPYSDLLTNKIDMIASTLRRLQQTNDPEAQTFTAAVLNVVQAQVYDGSEPYLYLETFLETDLHNVVVNILCEDSTYNPNIL
jgi:hypothetical protein